MEVNSMKFVLSLLIVFSAASLALAQENSKVEVYGGYSYLRNDRDLDSIRDLRGWNTSVTYNLNNFLGVKADFSGHYNDRTFVFDDQVSLKEKENDFTFLFGPQFSYRKNERIVPFAHVLIGGRRRTFSSSLIDTDFGTFNDKFSNTAFSAAFGGGLDIKLKKGVAFRLFQADYLLSRTFGFSQNNLRLGTGLVFRF
jgi:opacity protein-like surface antigen